MHVVKKADEDSHGSHGHASKNRETFGDFGGDMKKKKCQSILYIILAVISFFYAIITLVTAIGGYKNVDKKTE